MGLNIASEGLMELFIKSVLEIGAHQTRISILKGIPDEDLDLQNHKN